MRRYVIAASVAALAAALVAPAASAGTRQTASAGGQATRFIVVLDTSASVADARQAIREAGGTVERVHEAIQVIEASSTSDAFAAELRAADGVSGVARDHAVGTVRPDMEHRYAIETLPDARGAEVDVEPAAASAEPLAGLQWDMRQIRALDGDGMRSAPTGDPGVLVGVIDTGVDASHPDITPSFDAALSRNFTTDMPDIDGPCEETDCVDPADVDGGYHGTHVAGTIAAAENGLGLSGVAPDVTLANLRAGQDSGYFFTGPTVAALTYAADNGFDVVNMSYYVDPWLYNCPARDDFTVGDDAPSEDELAVDVAEQQAIIEAVSRALVYAFEGGVTLVGSAGNSHHDLGADAIFDDSSPDYGDPSYGRTVDEDCIDLPTEGPHVLSISALGPSGRKSYYSNYGNAHRGDGEEIDVSAPGGDFYDGGRARANMVLSTIPEGFLRAIGYLEEDGSVKPQVADRVIRDCDGDVCGYYAYLQGTSMASPHASGVAALIVSEFGRRDPEQGGLRLPPAQVEKILQATAQDTPCPNGDGGLYDYADPPSSSYDVVCSGTAAYNGFYGHGIIDASAIG